MRIVSQNNSVPWMDNQLILQCIIIKVRTCVEIIKVKRYKCDLTTIIVGLRQWKSIMDFAPVWNKSSSLRDSASCAMMSPMRERQSRPHFLQVWLVGVAVAMHAFRLALFSSAEVWIFSSPDFSCLCRTQRHLLPSAAASSQLSVLMSRAFMSRLQTSL